MIKNYAVFTSSVRGRSMISASVFQASKAKFLDFPSVNRFLMPSRTLTG